MTIVYKDGVNENRLNTFYNRFIDHDVTSIFKYLGFKDGDKLEISLKPGESDIDRGFIIHSVTENINYQVSPIMKNFFGDFNLALTKLPKEEYPHYIVAYKRLCSTSGYDWWNSN